MDLLVIGGTQFVGRAVVAAALDAGHHVTLLHRGRGDDDPFYVAEHLHADRDGDLAVLAGRAFDATIDVSAYRPEQVRSLAATLGGRGGHHVFVSTISVYDDPPGPGTDEDAALLPMPAAGAPAAYGPDKVACEAAAREAYGDRLSVVRPTFVVGPHDPTGRFCWWLLRIARGGRVLLPGPADQPIQLIDARDQGEWIVRLTEQRRSGTFNAARDAGRWGELWRTVAEQVGPPDTELVWADPAWLIARDAVSFPLWARGEPAWALAVSNARATGAGLRQRPLAESIADTLAWARSAPRSQVLRDGVGLDPAREEELLAELDG